MAVETKRWRPGRFPDERLDEALRFAFDNIYGLEKAALRGVVEEERFARGNSTVTGSLTDIETGLDTVTEVTASIDNGATAINEWVSARPSLNAVGRIDLYCWKPTAVADTTPIASTTARLVRWVAVGS